MERWLIEVVDLDAEVNHCLFSRPEGSDFEYEVTRTAIGWFEVDISRTYRGCTLTCFVVGRVGGSPVEEHDIGGIGGTDICDRDPIDDFASWRCLECRSSPVAAADAISAAVTERLLFDDLQISADNCGYIFVADGRWSINSVDHTDSGCGDRGDVGRSVRCAERCMDFHEEADALAWFESVGQTAEIGDNRIR